MQIFLSICKTLGSSIRGRGGIQRRGGSNGSGYNPNINVTGNDMPPDSNSKPFYRGKSND